MPLTKFQKNILQAISDAINTAGLLATKANQIAVYTSFINMHPNFKELYKERGNSYFDNKDWDAAINDYTIFINFKPNSKVYCNRGVAWRKKANEHDVKEEYDDAIKFSNNAIEPNYKLAKKHLVISYTKRGAALNGKASEHFAKNEYDQAIELSNKAIEDYKAVLAIDPDYKLAKKHLVISYTKRGAALNGKASEHVVEEYDQTIGLLNKAIKDYKAALAIDPDYQLAKNNLVISYTNRGSALEKGVDKHFARKEYDQAIELLNKVIKAYEAALAIDLNHQLAKNHLVVSYINRGAALEMEVDKHFARKEYDQIIELNNKAIKDYEAALAIDLNHQLAKNHLVVSYVNRGAALNSKASEHFARKEYDKAIELNNKSIKDCESALKINPNLQVSKDSLAISFANRGTALNSKASEHFARKEYDQAIELNNKSIKDCESALKINPNLQVAKDSLATSYEEISYCYEKKNDIGASYNNLKEAMKINCDAALKEKITKKFQRIEKLYNESRISASSASMVAAASSSSQVRKRTREEEIEVTEVRLLPALESFSNIAASAGAGIRIKQETVEAIPAIDIGELQITQALVKQESTDNVVVASSSNWQKIVQSQSSNATFSSSSFAARFEEQRAAKKLKITER